MKQQPFYPTNMSDTGMGMGPHSFLYVPRTCAAAYGTCHVHVVYHGCSSSVQATGGLDIVRYAGFNRWAEVRPRRQSVSRSTAH